jgi:uncharacterized protein
MNVDEVRTILAASSEMLKEFSVGELRLFGSMIHGDPASALDIDLLVDFKPGTCVGLFAFIRLRKKLAEVLGSPVDLVTPDALHPVIREGILREAVRVA